MTREEAIEQLLREIDNTYVDVKLAAKAAIDWSDQHPRKGLWNSEKVCDFIASHLTDKSIINNWQLHYQTVQDFIDDLRKAMED